VTAIREEAGNTSARSEKTMNYTPTEKNGVRYLRLTPGEASIGREEDALTLVALCAENGVERVLIPAECLTRDFMRLATCVAGLALQKLSDYNIKTVAVLDTGAVKGKFQNFLAESNRGNMFRAYSNFEDAENWLCGEGNIKKH
jgi:hypothetical protein